MKAFPEYEVKVRYWIVAVDDQSARVRIARAGIDPLGSIKNDFGHISRSGLQSNRRIEVELHGLQVEVRKNDRFGDSQQVAEKVVSSRRVSKIGSSDF